MEYAWIEQYATLKPGVSKDYKAEWEAEHYLLGNKMFGMRGTHPNGRPFLTLKLEPAQNISLQEEFEDIVPGYYMNKAHWGTVFLNGSVPKDIVEKMIDQAYRLILASLTGKAREALLGAH